MSTPAVAAPVAATPTAPVWGWKPTEGFDTTTTAYGADPALHQKAMQTGQVLTVPHQKHFKQGGVEFDWGADAWRKSEAINARDYQQWAAQQAGAGGAKVAAPPVGPTGNVNPAATTETGALGSVAAPLTAPTRPTGRITWQQDQQYWRDLDTYNKQNKLGAYR
jgi:hypothetical protein